MDRRITLSPQSAAIEQYPAVDVPDPYARQIADIIDRYSKLTLLNWIDKIERQREAAASLPQKGIEVRTASARKRHKHKATSASASKQGRYACPNCPEKLRKRKEFRRHVREKCEQEREWKCSECDDTSYKRREKLVDHHMKDHHSDKCDCSCLIDADVPLIAKSALGCVYCKRCFNNSREWTEHLIEHLEDDHHPPPSETVRIRSLLRHSRINAIWNAVCMSKSFEQVDLAWDTSDEHVKHLIECLEYQDTKSDEELRMVLVVLLDSTLAMKQFKHLHPSWTMSMYCDPAEIDKDYWMEPCNYGNFATSSDTRVQKESEDVSGFSGDAASNNHNASWMSNADLIGPTCNYVEATHSNNCYAELLMPFNQTFNDDHDFLSVSQQGIMAQEAAYQAMQKPLMLQHNTMTSQGSSVLRDGTHGSSIAHGHSAIDAPSNAAFSGPQHTDLRSILPEAQSSGHLCDVPDVGNGFIPLSYSTSTAAGAKRLKRTISNHMLQPHRGSGVMQTTSAFLCRPNIH